MRSSRYVQIPRDFVQLHKYVMLVVDVMFVNGLPFLFIFGAYVRSYVGIEKEQSKDLVLTHMLQPAPSHITNDTNG